MDTATELREEARAFAEQLKHERREQAAQKILDLGRPPDDTAEVLAALGLAGIEPPPAGTCPLCGNRTTPGRNTSCRRRACRQERERREAAEAGLEVGA